MMVTADQIVSVWEACGWPAADAAVWSAAWARGERAVRTTPAGALTAASESATSVVARTAAHWRDLGWDAESSAVWSQASPVWAWAETALPWWRADLTPHDALVWSGTTITPTAVIDHGLSGAPKSLAVLARYGAAACATWAEVVREHKEGLHAACHAIRGGGPSPATAVRLLRARDQHDARRSWGDCYAANLDVAVEAARRLPPTMACFARGCDESRRLTATTPLREVVYAESLLSFADGAAQELWDWVGRDPVRYTAFAVRLPAKLTINTWAHWRCSGESAEFRRLVDRLQSAVGQQFPTPQAWLDHVLAQAALGEATEEEPPCASSDGSQEPSPPAPNTAPSRDPEGAPREGSEGSEGSEGEKPEEKPEAGSEGGAGAPSQGDGGSPQPSPEKGGSDNPGLEGSGAAPEGASKPGGGQPGAERASDLGSEGAGAGTDQAGDSPGVDPGDPESGESGAFVEDSGDDKSESSTNADEEDRPFDAVEAAKRRLAAAKAAFGDGYWSAPDEERERISAEHAAATHALWRADHLRSPCGWGGIHLPPYLAGKPDPALTRDITRALERLVRAVEPAAGQKVTPRVSGAKLVREIVSRRYAASRWRREDGEPAKICITVDCSGSCSSYCVELGAAIVAVGERLDNIEVVWNSNGVPWRYLPDGSVGELPIDLWIERKYSAMIIIGDLDGGRIYADVQAANPDCKLVFVDNYSASVGPRPASKQAKEAAAACGMSPHHHWIGVGGAVSLARAMRGIAKEAKL